MNGQGEYVRIEGISASPGVAIGRVLVYDKGAPPVPRRRISAYQVEAETERFLQTLHQVSEEVLRTRRLVEIEQGADLARIFEAQLAMVQDVEVKERTLARIREKRYSAERAFSATLQDMKKAFDEVEDDYLRERLSDVLDFEYQVLTRLAGGERTRLAALRTNTIVVAHDLLPSEATELNHRLIKGLITDQGGATSHTSIIARSLGLPAVVGTERSSVSVQTGDPIIVDGDLGVVHVRPPPDILRVYRGTLRRQYRHQRDLQTQRDLPAVTRDGEEIVLMANVDLPAEVEVARDNGAQGVGMYRTEFLYMGHRLPDEEELCQTYSRIAAPLAPYPVVIRTLDLGGDKLSRLLHTPAEANPFLGLRGIRLCLDQPDLFKTQLRAILRAGAGSGTIRLMLPMVSQLNEVRRTKVLLDEVRAELQRAGVPFQRETKLGIMVEVPAVALHIEAFAREVDFFSLGTNDLTQYTLAVDRGSPQVGEFYDVFHPAVLQLIHRVIACGRRRGVEVSLCGEVAGDPTAVALLIGLGLKVLSMSPGLILAVKETIRATDTTLAAKLAERCLEAESGAAVRRLLANYRDTDPPGQN